MGDHYRQSMISMVESGQRSLRLEGAAAAAQALGVSLDYLAGLTDEPSQCDVIRVSGESMDPTLPDGCSILVDRSRRRRRHGRIYVARTDEGGVVKRLLHVRGHWTLSSDNTAWKPRTWPPTAEIIGEVRWMAQSF